MFTEEAALRQFLDRKVDEYLQPAFLKQDPLQVVHQYSLKQDQEIAGLLTALIAWGNRNSIIQNANRILQAMSHQPYAFIRQHRDTDLKPFLALGHRTLLPTDLLFLIAFLQGHYAAHDSLESAFYIDHPADMKERLIHFHQYVFAREHPERTRKHIATPARQSACKRLNLFLRWMVRSSAEGVDLGIWKNIPASELICPLDTHVSRVACRLGLLENPQASWKQAEQLTAIFRQWNPADPCRYDFALFGLGAEERIR